MLFFLVFFFFIKHTSLYSYSSVVVLRIAAPLNRLFAFMPHHAGGGGSSPLCI